ncbi:MULTISPECIES: hypothetical protein [unclassified Streptomyces]|uniref:hypothetical protein n=1 Tax=unclassified Streptomyces TaxID=2593676 RepID=UPI003448E502
MTHHTRGLFVGGAISALIALVGIPALASAADSEPPAAVAADTTQPSAIEDFTYPDAEKLQRERQIKLIKGDGHIVLADCGDSPQQIKVMTRRTGDFCFQANAKTGYLTLELAEVFYLETEDHPISADLTADGKTQTVDIAKGGFKSVGEGVGGAPTVLVEIRVTG